MRLLSLEHFLGLFSYIPANLNTLAKFRKHAKVKTARDIVPLAEYIANKSVSERDIIMVYENFVHRADYLARFYKVSLAVENARPLPIFGRTEAMPVRAINNDSSVVYKNIIRNMYIKSVIRNSTPDTLYSSIIRMLKKYQSKIIIDNLDPATL